MLHNTFPFPPLPNITRHQFVDLVGWSLLAIVGAAVLAVAARRLRWAKDAADKGSPLPSLGLLAIVGVTCWSLTTHGTAFPSSQWWHQPIAGLLDLYYSGLLGLLTLLGVASVVVFAAAALTACYAVLRWMSSPVEPEKWGAITGGQHLAIGWRLPRQERRLAAAVAARASSPKDGGVYVWWQRVHTSPANDESLPGIVTWFLVDHEVEDLDALGHSAAAAPTVRSAEAFAQDGVTRVRVEWDIDALAPARTPDPEYLGPQRRKAAPAAVIPSGFQGIS